MEKSAPYFLVGLFVSCSILAFVGFVIWLQGTHEKKNYAFYTIYFTESVSGLGEGADVEYKGVKVGKVIQMRLTPGRSELVKVDIGVAQGVPVQRHTHATLDTQGITGLVRLELETDAKDKQPPIMVADEQYPVLYGSGSQLSKVLQQIPAIGDQIVLTAGEMRDTSRSIKGLSDKLRSDPSQILYQPSNAGVEIPP
jgi:phospholipid/cholesterol/gamma-HCH transport system substrate-binding protein